MDPQMNRQLELTKELMIACSDHVVKHKGDPTLRRDIVYALAHALGVYMSVLKIHEDSISDLHEFIDMIKTKGHDGLPFVKMSELNCPSGWISRPHPSAI